MANIHISDSMFRVDMEHISLIRIPKGAVGPKWDALREKRDAHRAKQNALRDWHAKAGLRREGYKTRKEAEAILKRAQAALPDLKLHVTEYSLMYF